MQQIIVIHGASTFTSYDGFLKSLETKPIPIERLRYTPSWKELLQERLGAMYDVLLPAMPNAANARYDEWKLWFKRIAEYATDDCILIGHSMGGIFLAKYLSEETLPHKVKATILVAPPYSSAPRESLGDFELTGITDRFKSQAGRVVIYAGLDDPVIDSSEIDRYRQDLPDAEFNIMPAADHFTRSEFPELISRITRLT